MFAGPQWGVFDPVTFSFKRVFSHTWHFWVLFPLAFFVALLLGTMAGVIPLAIRHADEASPDFSGGEIAFLIILYAVLFIASTYYSAVVYNAALRETQGEEQSWSTAFKNAPFGRMLLSMIMIVLAEFAYVIVGAVLIGVAGSVVGWLGAVVAIPVTVGLIPVFLVLGFYPFYVLDGHGVGEAFSRACRDVFSHFWKLLGAYLILAIIAYALVLFTIGFGIVFAMPAAILGSAFIYRKVSGGDVVLNLGGKGV
ncbi:hypothetical protein C3E79_08450 [Corynebacterium liangguodongii]|uniref:Uncharacterized protein n=1 Tax=Corynebacterium liangguodongii TaxID=2079535 RepID=A0A2S0WFG9_9CORY|nr:hypothetical protein C3E79_08450 [Corynebacterium liangguodongii]PWB98727.1 hypothetical protein DF219_10525 [Corynebacterium liangguodongii]